MEKIRAVIEQKGEKKSYLCKWSLATESDVNEEGSV